MDHLCTSVSDHLPLLIHCLDQPVSNLHVSKRFRFENMWALHGDINSVIDEVWNKDCNQDIKSTINDCAETLQQWDCHIFGNVKFNIWQRKKDLQRLYNEVQLGADLNSLNQCLDDLNGLYDKEETKWRQRAKINWLKEGDRNSKTFHATATIRQRRNVISSIVDENGVRVVENAKMEKIIADYFRDIFTSNNPDRVDLESVVALMNSRVSPGMNKLLCRDFDEEEVRAAAYQMGPNKSPGPDGFTPFFYQRFWSIVKDNVCRSVLDFLNRGVPIPDINHTLVVLVPKCDNPQSPKDFRSISLCNVLFKIISKVLVNRLKMVLPQIIGPNQSAFVLGRQIFDSSMIAYETIHYMKNKRQGGKRHMALKLDLSKAYDQVEWPFLEGIMRKMGFTERWISLVMICVRTVTYSIQVNEVQTSTIFPSRGIRQGLVKIREWGSTDTNRKIHWKIWDSLCIAKLDGGLGFRDFEAFNLALLAKQCWRLIREESSLCCRVFKARYFRDETFMRATLGSNPSFVWRSLMAGREVLKKGCRWRIGDGMSVDIWRDEWLNNPPAFRPTPRPGTICQSNPVSVLFDDQGQWDVDLVRELFVDDDVARILSVPFFTQVSRDELIWSHSKNGYYTVRIEYHVARMILGRSSPVMVLREVKWRLLWGALVLPKVKYFMWRLVTGILPTKKTLQQKGIEISSTCEMCGAMEDSLFHIFFSCPFSQRVWDTVCPWLRNYLNNWERRDKSWECLLIKAQNLGTIEIVCVVLWLLWMNRNKVIHERICALPSVLVIKATRLVHEMEQSQCRRENNGVLQRMVHVWSPPARNCFKVNADAVFHASRNEAGLGVVIRDSRGVVFLCATARIDHVRDVLFAEIYALQFGLLVAKSYNLVDCEVESDSSLAISEINKLEGSLWEGGVLVDQIRHIASLFHSCKFSYVNRVANKFAHELAHLDCEVGFNCVWSGDSLPVCNPDC
ncbi:reverse transcriptase [Corchorus capsularis]|uniref:Reverse transcriptase n=1 Tax=Corchorus capsularis TaxID=210143 RepID=A0A1R3GVP2_COCAP|nr:reverse transcriptase [Corchorus capsularis]